MKECQLPIERGGAVVNDLYINTGIGQQQSVWIC